MSKNKPNTKTVPKFESHVMATLHRVCKTFCDRDKEYGDTWRDCQFLAMKAVARDLCCHIDDKYFRALATAAFVDMKYQRLQGGYKDDTIIDGVNYAAFLAEEMRQLTTVYQ